MTSTSQKISKKPIPWFLAIITGGLLLIGTTTYIVLKSSNSKIDLAELTVPVKSQDLSIFIQASGTVEPIQSVNISPKNPGRLQELKVEQGSIVSTGKLLAVMENTEIYARLREAEARVEESMATLNEAKARLTGDIKLAKTRLAQSEARMHQAEARIPRQIEQAQAQLNSAKSRLQLAQERVKRNESLLEEGAITKDRYDELINEEENALANVLEAQQRLQEVQNTELPEMDTLHANIAENEAELEKQNATAKAEVIRLEAGLKAAKAQRDLIKVQYDDTFILAPFDGIVTQRFATIGAFVTPTTSASNTASATSSSIIALATGLEVVAKVPEVDLGQLELGQSVEVVADAYPDKVFEGKVKRIAPEAIVEDNVTSFEVTIDLLTGQDKLKSKMNVDATFIGKKIEDTLVLPTVAIVTESGQTGVKVPGNDNKPIFKPITIGVSIGNKTQILDGISEGEKVFIDLPN